MDISRGLGIGVVMIIPSLVGGGAVWELIHSWGAVIAWILLMAAGYGMILYKGRGGKSSDVA